MKLGLRLTALFLLCAASFGAPAVTTVSADGIAVQSAQTRNAFPEGIVFTLTASSNVKIMQARLRYQILPEGPTTLAKVECEGEATVNCKSTIGSTASGYMVPFAEMRYMWEITDTAGQTLITNEEKVMYQDTRFQWRSLSDGNVTGHYYTGDEATIRNLLKIGRETIDKVSALERTQIDFPVKIVMYQSIRDLQPAVASRRTPNSNSVTLGEVSAADTALISREVLALDTLRHEVAHIVTNYATKGTPGGPPPWLEEGISMYAQNEVESEYRNALAAAIKADKVYPLSSLNSTAPRSNDPSLYYGQAHAIVRFIIEKYGESKFSDFIVALKGNGTEDAVKKVYGFDLNKIENDWRQSVGLPGITQSSGATSGSQQLVVPTIEPFGNQGGSSGARATPAPGGSSTTGAPSKGGGSSSALPIIGGVIAAVVVLGGGGAMLLRRKKA